MSKQVIALKDGFYRGHRIREGQEFTCHDEKLGKWMRPVGMNDEPTATSDKPEPNYNELLVIAKEKGLTFATKPKKAELIAALASHEAGGTPAVEGEAPVDPELLGDGADDGEGESLA